MLIKELQKIYDSEINFFISTFWDGGFSVKLGDEMNGFKAETTTPTIESAIEWLISSIMFFYPKSLYVFARTNIINKIREGFVDTDKFTFLALQNMLEIYETKHPHTYSELAYKYRTEEKFYPVGIESHLA